MLLLRPQARAQVSEVRDSEESDSIVRCYNTDSFSSFCARQHRWSMRRQPLRSKTTTTNAAASPTTHTPPTNAMPYTCVKERWAAPFLQWLSSSIASTAVKYVIERAERADLMWQSCGAPEIVTDAKFPLSSGERSTAMCVYVALNVCKERSTFSITLSAIVALPRATTKIALESLGCTTSVLLALMRKSWPTMSGSLLMFNCSPP